MQPCNHFTRVWPILPSQTRPLPSASHYSNTHLDTRSLAAALHETKSFESINVQSNTSSRKSSARVPLYTTAPPPTALFLPVRSTLLTATCNNARQHPHEKQKTKNHPPASRFFLFTPRFRHGVSRVLPCRMQMTWLPLAATHPAPPRHLLT